MKTAIVLGTRPEIIKMSPIIRELQLRKIDFLLLHTGQHYSYNMDLAFFEQLGLPAPDRNLHSGSGTHAEETARILEGVERFIEKEKPGSVLVEGDTNTVLAGSLAASKGRVLLGHVEAGLRSGDRRMPEEINRIVADHVSDILFAPTYIARENLQREGINERSIHTTGNTIVDAIKHDIPLANKAQLAIDVPTSGYLLLTLHRQENVDDRGRLKRVLGAISSTSSRLGIPLLYPIHPRTRKRIAQFGLKLGDSIKAVPPQGYFEFLKLMQGAGLVLTDSGGVQEETCILKVPCVTIRDNTERPETIKAGSNVLTSAEPARMLAAAKEMMARKRSWTSPFGDGNAGRRIINILTKAEVPRT